MPEEYLTGTVVDQRYLDDRLRILRIATDQPVQFTAGQFTKIGLPTAEGKPLMRAYSFVNPPTKRPFEFLYDVIQPQGNLTPLLDSLSAGSEVLVSARPNGLLILDNLPEADNVFFIATGTGIGPFLSILQTAEPWRRFKRLVLVYSVRTAAEMIYRDLIEKFAQDQPEIFRFVPLVTREKSAGTLNCRVTEALANGELEKRAAAPISSKSQFMLCGNPEMVQLMCDMFKDRGLERNRRSKPGNVTIEKYW